MCLVPEGLHGYLGPLPGPVHLQLSLRLQRPVLEDIIITDVLSLYNLAAVDVLCQSALVLAAERGAVDVESVQRMLELVHFRFKLNYFTGICRNLWLGNFFSKNLILISIKNGIHIFGLGPLVIYSYKSYFYCILYVRSKTCCCCCCVINYSEECC